MESKGWSTTIYTWSELESAAERQSLFVQHLKRDSVILKDADDRLRHILAVSDQRSSYAWERKQAMTLFSAIECIPDAPWGGIWALDIAYVAFRSFAVAFLADENLVTFSMSEIIPQMCRCGLLRPEDSKCLLELRAWKKGYRDGGRESPPISKTLKLLDTVDRRLKAGIHIHRTDPETFSSWAISEIRKGSHWYRSARLWEAFLELNDTSDSSKILGMLRMPQIYGRSLRHHLDYLAVAA
jgi:hypothetical protein